jgi:hypothetical protein
MMLRALRQSCGDQGDQTDALWRAPLTMYTTFRSSSTTAGQDSSSIAAISSLYDWSTLVVSTSEKIRGAKVETRGVRANKEPSWTM